ncbi:MAG: hypothetical protein JXR63_13775 [Spirochaetales bacterium]|nr:hypothetical protein [Spirochaetales bacterium]
MENLIESSFYLQRPAIVSTQWIPLGKNNITALNRFIGSHKQYTEPTEFGIKGCFKDISRGSFKMQEKGILLTPKRFDFSSFVEMEIEDEFGFAGIKLDSSGYARIGIEAEKPHLCTNLLKSISSDLNFRFVKGLYPVLTDSQIDLLQSIYGTKEIIDKPFYTSAYPLFVAEAITDKEKKILTGEQKNKAILALTDWIIYSFECDNSEIFVGISGILCLGAPSEELKKILDHIIFTQSIFTVSQRLYDRTNALSRIIHNFRDEIPRSKLKKLTRINDYTTEAASDFSRLEVLNNMLNASIQTMQAKWEEMPQSLCLSEEIAIRIKSAYNDELDKASDREINLSHLKNELENVDENLNQRMNQIITKNSEFMNIILLLMTVLTVVGFGDIFGLSLIQKIIVLGIMLPFMFTALFYIKNYLTNYREDKKLKKGKI